MTILGRLAEAMRQQNWFAVALEILVVIIGVLVALQVDTWRTARSDSTREREQLEALKEDFASNRDRYAATIEVQERMQTLSVSLLRVMAQGTVVDPDSFGEMVIGGALSWYEAEPVTGSYDALIASGDIGLLKDPLLRRELAEFSAELDAGFEDHDNLMDILAELQRLAAPTLVAVAPSPMRDSLSVTPEENERARAELRGNDAFHGLLAFKILLERNRLRRQHDAASAVERILSLIQVGLGEREAPAREQRVDGDTTAI